MMARARSRRSIANTTFQAYDDIEGLITSLGLISALLLAMAVPLQYLAIPVNQQMADFRTLLCTSQVFRTYVVEVMGWWDIGDYEHETFNFSVPIGGGKSLDINHELSQGIKSRHPDAEGLDYDDASVDGALHIECVSDPIVLATTEALVHDFPMKFVGVWINAQSSDTSNAGIYRFSQWTEKMSAYTLPFIMSPLLLSLFMYVSLVMSPSREDASGVSLRAWNRVGLAAVIFGYMVLVFGIIAFFFVHGRFILSQSAYFNETYAYFIASFYYVGIPALFGSMFLSIFVWGYSTWEHRKSQEAESGTDETPSARVICEEANIGIIEEQGDQSV